jgi:hypothetical protein
MGQANTRWTAGLARAGAGRCECALSCSQDYLFATGSIRHTSRWCSPVALNTRCVEQSFVGNEQQVFSQCL